MIDANTPLEKIAEMCNTMEDLRNLLKQCDFKTNTEDAIQISPELLQETISKTKHLKTVTRSDIQRLLRIEYSKAAKLLTKAIVASNNLSKVRIRKNAIINN